MSRRGRQLKAKPVRSNDPLPPAPYYGMHAGATRTDSQREIDEAMSMTHDALIQELATARTTGVRWGVYGPDRRDSMITMLADTGAATDSLTAWFVQHPEGVLVVAYAGQDGSGL